MEDKTNLGTLSFFCDESCYQINDGYSHMSIASVWCRKDRKKQITKLIQDIKLKHNITKSTELKWGKVSPATLEMYKEIFSCIKKFKYLKIRIVVTNKEKIKNDAKDRWYETMYYCLIEFPIKQILDKYMIEKVDVFSDVMNSHSTDQMNKISNYLEKHFKKNNKVNFISKVCESKDVTLIQIADLLAGASTYTNRRVNTSQAKLELAKHIQKTFSINFTETSRSKDGEISNYNVFLYDPKVKKDEF